MVTVTELGLQLSEFSTRISKFYPSTKPELKFDKKGIET